MTTISRLAALWGITVIEAATSDNPSHADYQNRSASCGDDWILLGVYTDPSLKLLSFFHELGHCVDVRHAREQGLNRVERSAHHYHHYREASAWRTGLRLAQDDGIVFSPSSLTWARTQLRTYFRDGHPEKTPLRFLSQAEGYAFGGNR